MDENTFNNLAEQELDHIERQLEALDEWLDVERQPGGVIEVEFADGSKMVINRHGAAKEIWVAARGGGFHFAPGQGTWVSARDGRELYACLSALLSAQAGQAITLVQSAS